MKTFLGFVLIFLGGECYSQENKLSKSWFDDAFNATSKLTSEAWKATADTRAKTWESTKKLSADAVDGTIKLSSEAWKATADTRAKSWDKSKALATDAWDSTVQKTEQFYKEHETGIKTAGAAFAVGAALYLGNQISNSSDAHPAFQGPYSHIPDLNTTTIKPGAFFSNAQKEALINANIEKNGGVLKSDLSGTVLTLPSQYTKGYLPSPNEVQIDHLFPRSQGGTNSFENAQILSRQENLLKGAAAPK